MGINGSEDTFGALDITSSLEAELGELYRKESHLTFEKGDLEGRFGRLIDGEERERVKLRIEKISKRLSDIKQEIITKKQEFRDVLISILKQDSVVENKVNGTREQVEDIIG